MASHEGDKGHQNAFQKSSLEGALFHNSAPLPPPPPPKGLAHIFLQAFGQSKNLLWCSSVSAKMFLWRLWKLSTTREGGGGCTTPPTHPRPAHPHPHPPLKGTLSCLREGGRERGGGGGVKERDREREREREREGGREGERERERGREGERGAGGVKETKRETERERETDRERERESERERDRERERQRERERKRERERERAASNVHRSAGIPRNEAPAVALSDGGAVEEADA